MYKKLLIIFIYLFNICFVFSKPPWISNLNYAKQISKKQKKPILIDFYSESCYYCKVIEKNVYRSKEFQKWKSKWILTVVDGDQNPDIADQFHIMGYPTVVFLDYNGVEIGRISGYLPKADFLHRMEIIYHNKDLLQNLLKKSKEFPENYYYYFQLGLYYNKAKNYKISENYLSKALQVLQVDQNYYQNKKNLLYNLAVQNTKIKNYSRAFSYWNAYISWIQNNDYDYPFARYYRALSLLNRSSHYHTFRKKFKSLNFWEQKMVLQDLQFASKHLPDSYEKKQSKKLLSEINP